MLTVLVTGGAGYIGSHTCKALWRAGYLPVAYDNLSTGHRRSVRWGPLVVGDIADHRRLADALARHRPCAVIHFAAHAYVGESAADPEKYYHNNVAGTLALLATLRENNIGDVVFSSSCAVYGEVDGQAITEGRIPAPVNPYGRTKHLIELALRDYFDAYGVSSVALRYFNAAGADADGELGEDHDPETHLIPRALMAASGLIDRLQVFGADYDTPDGTPVRDYVHVADLADAHVAALRLLHTKRGAHAFNLGNGRGYSVREIVDAVERCTGRPVRTTVRPRRPGDPGRLVADPSKARDELGFRPRFAAIDDIVASAWAWHQKLHGHDAVPERSVAAAG